MKKTIAALSVVGLIAGSFVAIIPQLSLQKTDAAVSSWQKGASVVPRWNTDFGSDTFKQSMQKLQATGANYVTLIIPYYQSNAQSSDIAAGWNTPTDSSLIAGISYIHSLGMHVALKPHLELYSGGWRGTIAATDRNTWFAGYSNMLNHLGDIGKAQGVEGIVIGTELINMSEYTVNSDNTQRWIAMINSLRSHFSGYLTYSANWGESGIVEEAPRIGFWSHLDYLGLSAYYYLPGDNQNSVQSFMNSWDNWNKNRILPLYNQYKKPILFTEIGYQSKDGVNMHPWDYTAGGGVNQTIQANLYDALMRYWNNQSYVQGVSLWFWDTDPGAGGSGNADYTPQNKQAESVMKNWFSQGGTGGGGGNQQGTWSSSASFGTMQVGQQGTINVTVGNTGQMNNVLVDVEIYNSSNSKTSQTFFQNQNIGSSQPGTYQVSWIPPATGTYTIKIGVFSNDWSTNYYWANSVATINVGTGGGGGGTTTPGGPTVTASCVSSSPSVSVSWSDAGQGSAGYYVDIDNNSSWTGGFWNKKLPAGTTQTTAPSGFSPYAGASGNLVFQPQATYYTRIYYIATGVHSPTVSFAIPNCGGGTTQTYATDIWWPTNGVTISGTQPFKAMLQGIDVSQYDMYWQVEGGTLSVMGNSSVDYPHKESQVNVSGWTSKGNGPYSVNFVSKDKSGNIIGQKAISVNVMH